MYPGFDDGSNKDPNPYSQPKPAQKKGGMSKDVQTALYDIKSTFSLKSVKQLFSAFQILFQMNIKNTNIGPIPIRAVFLQNYPIQKPRIYSGRALGHKLINEITGEIKYEEIMQWTPKIRFVDVLNRIQNIFNNSDVKQDPFTTYVDEYKRKLQQYSRDINSITNTPIPQNPPQNYLQTIKLPQPPVFNFDYLKKEKKYHSELQNEVQSKIQIYNTLVIDYKENQSKAKYISERFGKGRILKEMEAAMENAELDPSIEGIENQLADFHNKRKNYHKMEILKQKYLES